MKKNKFSTLNSDDKKIVCNFIDTAISIVDKTVYTEKAFNPFAVVLTSSKKYKIIGIDDVLAQNTINAINTLRESLIPSMKKQIYNSISLIYNVCININNKKHDAICMDISISDRFSVRYLYPYIKK